LSVPASQMILAELGISTKQYDAFLAGDADAPASKQDVAAALRLQVVQDDDARASNVCAVLRGSDPKLREEAIVYSAHMDHVGMRMDGEVFNGADDNASGSAGLLAIASAYANAKEKPRRSIVFLSVSGEELGLWGSQYYSDNPTWQLDKIVADINTDMIGRSGAESGPLEITVTPSFRHAKYSTIVRDAAGFASQLGVSFTSGDKYYQRSDHYNFAKKGIPVVFFCTGEHEDYHQVTDTADKLDGEKMQRIARLAFWTGWHVAAADSVPRGLGKQEDW
jgi:Zn-dependent M28 family amino/carboxypeptidase